VVSVRSVAGAVWAVSWRSTACLSLWGLLLAPVVLLLAAALPAEGLDRPGPQLVMNAWGVVALVLASWVIVRWVDKRELSEIGLGMSSWPRYTALGTGFGLALALGAMGILVALDWLSFEPNPDAEPAAALVLALGIYFNAFLQELLFRGFLLSVSERFLGLRTAVVVNLVAFLAVHPGAIAAGWVSATNLLLAGLLLTLAFLRTRELGFVTALHWGWNGAQALLGVSVTGHALEGSWTQARLEPGVMSGGEFGLEGGLVGALVVLVGVGVLAAKLARRKGAPR
jgi:membrane protease YdiL (CAAX protease family)